MGRVMKFNGQHPLLELMLPFIGVFFLVWNLSDLYKGKARRAGTKWIASEYFGSNPIAFSIQGGLNLTIALFILVFLMQQMPDYQSIANKPLFFACLLATWVVLSILSYIVGFAGESWRKSHNIPSELPDPNIKEKVVLKFHREIPINPIEEQRESLPLKRFTIKITRAPQISIAIKRKEK
jgi:hypothetical protein